jgi:hypothetical protein
MTAVEFLQEALSIHFTHEQEMQFIGLFHQALEMEKQQMLEFGSKVTERWGLTKVEPHYIEDEYNKFLQK